MITEFTPPGLRIQPTSNEKDDIIKSSKAYIHDLWKQLYFLLAKLRKKLDQCVCLKILRKISINSAMFAWDTL